MFTTPADAFLPNNVPWGPLYLDPLDIDQIAKAFARALQHNAAQNGGNRRRGGDRKS